MSHLDERIALTAVHPHSWCQSFICITRDDDVRVVEAEEAARHESHSNKSRGMLLALVPRGLAPVAKES